MASSGDTKPEQYADPLAPTPEQLASLPHDNAGPKLNAIIWSLTAISGIVLGLRIYCRLLRRKGLWWDDVFLIAAWVRQPQLSEDIPFSDTTLTDQDLHHGGVGPYYGNDHARLRFAYLGF